MAPNVRKSEAAWGRLRTRAAIRVSAKGFGNRTDAVKRGKRVRHAR